jgi:hypothetical protein
VFPIVGGRKVEHLQRNIDALKLDLSEGDTRKIESVVPFDFGYPHSMLSGDRYSSISSANPAFFVKQYGYFDGVQEVAVCASSASPIKIPLIVRKQPIRSYHRDEVD